MPRRPSPRGYRWGCGVQFAASSPLGTMARSRSMEVVGTPAGRTGTPARPLGRPPAVMRTAEGPTRRCASGVQGEGSAMADWVSKDGPTAGPYPTSVQQLTFRPSQATEHPDDAQG